MEYKYFGKWHRYRKEPLEPLTVYEAQCRHSEGETYCVVIVGETGTDQAFIEITSDYFSVNFLDAKLRVFLTYDFEDVSNGRLFLNQAFFCEYRNEDDQPSLVTSYFFNETGSLTIERSQSPFNTAEVTEGRYDVEGNWENRPEFGEYLQLLHKDRKTFAGPSQL